MPRTRTGPGALAAVLLAAGTAGCAVTSGTEPDTVAPSAATSSPHASQAEAQAETASPSPTAAEPSPASTPETAAPLSDVDTIVQALNEARGAAGAQTLTTDPALAAVATAQAELIADGADGFSDALGGDVAAAGYPSHAAQAVGALRVTTAIEDWLSEPAIRETFVDDAFSAVGVGEAQYEGGGSVYVAVLAYTALDGNLPLGSQGAERVLELTNAERARTGLAPLTVDSELNAAAQLQADHQAEILEMTHDGLGGLGARFDTAGYDYRLALENVAVGQRTLEQVTQGWIDSPEHYENIVNREVTEMGFAATVGADGRAYYAQTFGVAHGDPAPEHSPAPSPAASADDDQD